MNKILKSRGCRVFCAVLIVIILVALNSLSASAATLPVVTVNQVFNLSDGVFSYIMKPLKTDTPMPAGSTAGGYAFTIAGTGSAKIKLPDYGRQGLYRYNIYQVIGAVKPGYTYDRRVYTLEVYVDERLDAKVIIYDENGKKTEYITFQNEYDLIPTDPNLMADPPVRKTVFGSPGRRGTFTFKLEARNASYPMPAGSANGVKTISISGSGSNRFGTWSYDKTGTYYYTVYEVNGGERGYTYDRAVYTITDTVADENGQLVLTRVVTNRLNKPVTSLIFNNYYNYNNNSGGETDVPDTEPTEIFELDDPDVPLDNFDVPTNRFGAGGGPKTGDDGNTLFYLTLFVVSGVTAACATLYLVLGGKRERRNRRV